MKKKKLVVLIASVSALAASAAVALAVNKKGLSNPMFTRAGTIEHGSYTITAANLNNGNGDFEVGGERWHYEGVSVDGNTVTLTGLMYTVTRSGQTAAANRRGNGYTRMVFEDLDLSEAAGPVYHEFDVNWTLKKGGNPLAADNDLTFSGTVAASDRRGVQIVQGNPSSLSFTSLTMYYDCTDVVPQVDINNDSLSIGVGEDGQLTASKSDVYDGDVVSYSWASDDEDVATVVGNGLNATVTGVAAGTATITVTMTVNGTNYTDTVGVTVTAAAAQVVEMSVLDTSRVEGAGIFCRFNPSSASMTASGLDALTVSATMEFADPGVSNDINHYVLQEKGDASYTAYVVCDSAVGLNGAFTVTVDFKDNGANKIYRAVFHFNEGALAQELNLNIASDTVVVGTPATLTATKGYYLAGEPTFEFVSSDTDVLTVSASGNVATLNGVAAGTATVTVTMSLNGESYVKVKTITVTGGMNEVALTITSAAWGGAGCQFFNDMQFAQDEGTFQLSDYSVNVEVTGVSFSYSGLGACLQGAAIYLTFTAAPGPTDQYTISCSLGRGSNLYTFSVSFLGTDML
jgi:uncharacterized protein YjdB